MSSRESSPVSRRSRSTSRASSRSNSRSHSPSSDVERSSTAQSVVIAQQNAAAVSPASLPRAPRRNEFANAVFSIPPPPQVGQNTRQTRFVLPETQKEQFEVFARGKDLPSSERATLLKELPLPNSVFALPPILEDSLRSAGKDLCSASEAVTLTGGDLRRLHELLLGSLVISETILSLGANGEGAPFAPQVAGYLSVHRTLLSAGIHDVLSWQRDAVLRSWGISRSRIPAISWTPLDETPVLHRVSNEIRPSLFGSDLRRDLSAGDVSLSKGLLALKNSSKDSSSIAQRKSSGRQRFGSEDGHPSAKQARGSRSNDRSRQSAPKKYSVLEENRGRRNNNKARRQL